MKKLHSFSLPIIGLLVFSLATTVYTDNKLRMIISELITERTVLLESALLGEITYEEAEAKLPRIVEKPLLEQDLNALEVWKNTDFDRVIDFRIDRCKKESENDLGIIVRAEITWFMCDLEGEYTINDEYLLVIQKEEDIFGKINYKLAEMKVREKT